MSKSSILVALALALSACGSDESPASQSIRGSVGGSSTATTTVGAIGFGGSDSTATGGASTNVAGAPSTVGTSALGGSGTVASTPTGGATSSTAIGGSPPRTSGGGSDPGAGGSTTQATGGSSTTTSLGGSATGGYTGRTPPGGSPSTGGSSPKGGSSTTATGGSTMTATGGSTISTTTGGNPSSGGSSTTGTGGSSATGGFSTTTTATGGSNPGSGGSLATGGSSTTATGGSTSIPTPVPTRVSVGEFHTCTVLSDGHVKCWGTNTFGQLGNGTTTNSPTPVVVSGISNAVQVSNYFNHTCALLADGTVKCWGINTYGQLGNGVAGCEGSDPSAPNPNPVQMLGVTGAIKVATGNYTTCVILADHTVKCLGYRRYGTLGDGVDGSSSNYYSKDLVQVVGINNAIDIGSNSRYTCALLSDNTIKCWGQPNFNYPEFTAGTNGSSTPVLIPNTPNALQLSVGENNICYMDNYQSYCWGEGRKLTTPTIFSGPISLGPDSTLENYVYPARTAVSQHQVCIVYNQPTISTKSVVLCRDYTGTVVSPETADIYGTPVDPKILDAADVSTNVDPVNFDNPTCAILKSGTMKCWGSRTGNSSSPTSTTPVIPDGF